MLEPRLAHPELTFAIQRSQKKRLRELRAVLEEDTGHLLGDRLAQRLGVDLSCLGTKDPLPILLVPDLALERDVLVPTFAASA